MAIPVSLAPVFFPPVRPSELEEEAMIVGFNLQKQQPSYWCWVEVAASVYEFHEKRSIERCKLARGALKAKLRNWVDVDCCGGAGLCNEPLDLLSVLDFTGNLVGKSLAYYASELTIKSVIPTNGKGSPIVCGIYDKGKGGHAVAIVGWYILGQKLWLWIADPVLGKEPLPWLYEELTNTIGFQWYETHFTGAGGKIL